MRIVHTEAVVQGHEYFVMYKIHSTTYTPSNEGDPVDSRSKRKALSISADNFLIRRHKHIEAAEGRFLISLVQTKETMK